MAKKHDSAPKSRASGAQERKLICQNRRATHDFAISERLEAGLVLTGTEVKSCRLGKVQLNDAYIFLEGERAVLINSHIAEYSFGNRMNHAPTRTRTLLMHRHEIDKLSVKLRERGFTAVPLSMYFLNGRVKVEIGVGKGKTNIDRRQDIKSREAKREIDRAMRDRG